MGAGKTTAAPLVAQLLDAGLALEPSAVHPFIADYYRDPRRYAMETELAFVALQLHAVKQHDATTPIVSDFSPAKNLIFAKLAMDEAEQRILGDLDRSLWAANRPSLVVFLDVPVEVCLARVRERGRAFEQALVDEDVESLRTAYVADLNSLGDTVIRLPLSGEESPQAVAALIARSAREVTGS